MGTRFRVPVTLGAAAQPPDWWSGPTVIQTDLVIGPMEWSGPRVVHGSTWDRGRTKPADCDCRESTQLLPDSGSADIGTDQDPLDDLDREHERATLRRASGSRK